MQAVIDWVSANLVNARVISTLALLLILITVRAVTLSRLRRMEGLSNDLRRRWSSQIRLWALLLLILGLMIIWGSELRAFALSVVAIAAAIVIATKELIMCVSGALLKTGGRSFVIGDRIEIGAFRGDVVDQTLLTTTLLEIGPGPNIHQHTGRSVVIPNSLMLTTPVINETFFDEYVLHAFAVPIGREDNLKAAESALLQAARDECASYFDTAREHIEELVRREGLEPLSVEPRVTLRMDEPGKTVMLARIPAPARRKGRIEQAILRRYLARMEAERSTGDDEHDAGSGEPIR